VGTAQGRAEDLAAGETDTLQGSLPQPTWSTVSVTITKVSENVDEVRVRNSSAYIQKEALRKMSWETIEAKTTF
jgi:hypothetical protein